MKKILFLASVIALFASCSHSSKFSDSSKDFPDYQWKKGKEVVLSIAINQIIADGKLKLSFRHVDGFQFANLPLEMSIISPSGKTEVANINLLVKKENGESRGDCSGDYCDLDTVIKSHISFPETGTYTFKIKNAVQLASVPNVMEIGVSIEK